MRIAPEIILSSIQMGNWSIRDVKAWILDIPERPGLGLLGLNYLRHFHMELNSDKGVLLMKPR